MNNAALGLAGFAISFVMMLLNWRGVKIPDAVFYPLLALGVLMLLASIGWAVWAPIVRLFRPAIVIRAQPPTHDNHLKLLVVNHDRTQDFEADVVDFADIAGAKQQQYRMKWRGHSGPTMRIFAGKDAELDVARITPPVREPVGLLRRGSFLLFSASLPEGWSVSAGDLNDITTLRKVLTPTDPADEQIALKVRVTGSEGISKTCRVTLGFDRPYEIDTFKPRSLVRIEVDDWPKD